MANLPFSHVVAPADPNVEGVNSGMNAGSCFPVTGYATDVVNAKETDLFRQAIVPIRTQPIGWGGDSVVPGQETADLPIVKTARYGDSDFNDQVLFSQADAAVGPGQEYDTVNGGFYVGTGTVQIGDWVTGVIPQA